MNPGSGSGADWAHMTTNHRARDHQHCSKNITRLVESDSGNKSVYFRWLKITIKPEENAADIQRSPRVVLVEDSVI